MDRKIDKELLTAYVNGNITPENKKYVEQIFSDENYKEELQEILRSEWIELNHNYSLEEHNLDHILHNLYYKLNHHNAKNHGAKMRTLWRVYLKIAAVFLFPLALAYIIYSQIEKQSIDQEKSYAVINAPLGTRVSFSLPDGSSGWLNSGSKLKYPVVFTDTRNVELSGEAYFDVVKNTQKPFQVHTSHLNISVLGTKFNVNAYENESNINVVLESGKVVLLHPEGDEILEMKPNEKAEYNLKEKELNTSEVISEKYSLWKEGKLIFRNDPLDAVVRKLSRWYNVDIELRQTSKADFRLRATFEDEEIEEVLRLIKLTFPIDYDIEKRKRDNEGKFSKRRIIINVK